MILIYFFNRGYTKRTLNFEGKWAMWEYNWKQNESVYVRFIFHMPTATSTTDATTANTTTTTAVTATTTTTIASAAITDGTITPTNFLQLDPIESFCGSTSTNSNNTYNGPSHFDMHTNDNQLSDTGSDNYTSDNELDIDISLNEFLTDTGKDTAVNTSKTELY